MVIKKQPQGRLNTDASLSVLPAGDFTNAENVRMMSSRQGRITEIQNVEGNRLVPYPSVDNKEGHECIGVYEDRANNRVYYFLFQEAGDHKVLSYDATTDTITKLVHNNEIKGDLNFQQESWIQSSFAGGVLYFTDDVNPPRKIGVDAILSGDYTIGDVEELLLCAVPGKLPLGIQKVNAIDAGVDSNQVQPFNALAEEAFQFAYRYTYYDNSVSVLSPYSDFSNFENDDRTQDNKPKDAVIVTLPLFEDIPKRVKRVDFCYREGNTGNWFVFERFDEAAIAQHRNFVSPLRAVFFNRKIADPLSDEYSSKLFDIIPRKAKALDIAKNRLFLGNIEIGYDTPEVTRLSVSRDEETGETTINADLYLMTHRIDVQLGILRYNHYFLAFIDEGLEIDGWYVVEYDEAILESIFEDVNDIEDQDPPDGDDFYNRPVLINISEQKFLGTETPTAEVVAANFAAFFNTDYGTIGSATLVPDGGNNGSGIIPVTNATNYVLFPEQGRHFKAGGRYQIGLAFYDINGQTGGVYTNSNCIVDIPVRDFDESTYTRYLRWTHAGLNSDIPEWATHYRILRTKNLITDFFLQVPFKRFKYVDEDASGTYELADDPNQGTIIALNLDSISSEGLGYEYNEGDVARVILANNSNYTLDILGQIGTYLLVESEGIKNYLQNNSDEFTNSEAGIVEIYQPRKSVDTEVFYEVATYALNVTGATPEWNEATGQLLGDTWLKTRLAPFGDGSAFGFTATCEAMSINDNQWQRWVQGIGRTNIVVRDDNVEDLPNRVLYSNPFIQDSKINGLSSFDLLDRFDTDERTGDIYALKYTSSTNNSENVLLAIGSNNTSSVYIGQTRVIDDAGAAILATSGSVVGTINILKGDHGTVNPESVVLARAGRVFWYDKNSNAIVRYSSNGLFPVSDFGINSIMPKLQPSGKIPAGYDNRYDELLIKVKTQPDGLYPALDDYLEFEKGVIYYTDINDVRDAPEGIELVEVSFFPLTVDFGDTEPGYEYVIRIVESDGAGDVLLDDVYQATINEDTEYSFSTVTPSSITIDINTKSSFARVELYRKRINPHQFISPAAKTLVYNDPGEGFVGSRSFDPEAITPINDRLVTFKEGSLYVHDSTINSFYGELYSSLIAMVYNEPNPYVKVPRGVSIEGERAPDEVHVRITERYTQSSDIVLAEFRRNETVWYAEIKRDRLTEGFDDFEKALLHGETLRGQNIMIFFKWDGSEPINARYLNLRIQPSDGHPIINQ